MSDFKLRKCNTFTMSTLLSLAFLTACDDPNVETSKNLFDFSLEQKTKFTSELQNADYDSAERIIAETRLKIDQS